MKRNYIAIGSSVKIPGDTKQDALYAFIVSTGNDPDVILTRREYEAGSKRVGKSLTVLKDLGMG